MDQFFSDTSSIYVITVPKVHYYSSNIYKRDVIKLKCFILKGKCD